jgi:hypothetical protein
MARYKVQIDERFTHSMLIEAESEDEATDIAYNLLRDGITRDEEMQQAHDYEFEATEYMEDWAEAWD